jgi:hypothetical protein
MNEIEQWKAALPLPSLLLRLGLTERELTPGEYPCPLHRESRGNAFSIAHKEGRWLWNCFGACGCGGDEVTLLEKVENLSRSEAIRRLRELAIGHRAPTQTTRVKAPKVPRRPRLPQPPMEYPADLHTGSYEELCTVAKLRSVSEQAVIAMSRAGFLGFATVCGAPSWLVLDASGKAAEARRMDGCPYSDGRGLAARKAHTLKNCQKSWPLGLLSKKLQPPPDASVLLLEGSGDFVTAHHFCQLHPGGQRWLPVAFLGACVRKIHPDAAQLLGGRVVRIVPHCDPAGEAAGIAWARLLRDIGCSVHGFNLAGMRTATGAPVKDLNDCTQIHPDDFIRLRLLLS